MGLDDPAAAGLVEHRETYERRRRDPRLGRATSQRPGRTRAGADPGRRRAGRRGRLRVDVRPARAAGARLGVPDLAGPAAAVAARRDRRRGGRPPAAGAASGRPTTASTARTRSSRRSSTGGRPTTSPIRSQMPIPGVPEAHEHVPAGPPRTDGTQVEMRIARPRSAKDRAIARRRCSPLLGRRSSEAGVEAMRRSSAEAMDRRERPRPEAPRAGRRAPSRRPGRFVASGVDSAPVPFVVRSRRPMRRPAAPDGGTRCATCS